ncbi:FG-GAP-like repeat-containing protein [Cellulosimicrobium sp. SH8]|uniref:FG-GAP-like repeat-containing protein n=1 Tax=Cellulosimicrobium sp. SH8 TaxID=2952936 RepID=UPI0021F2E9B3|nr:FG-GAP-like repeat-containing protein [Cellulosimicrobium sp. SH8]
MTKRWTTVLTVLAVTATSAVTGSTTAGAASPAPRAATSVAPHVAPAPVAVPAPVAPEIDETPLEPVDASGEAPTTPVPSEAGAAEGPGEQVLPEVPADDTTSPEGTWSATSPATGATTVVGVTWDLGSAGDDVVVEVRSRTGTVWTGWTDVHAEDAEQTGGSGEQRDGTEPLFVGDVDEVEARVLPGQGAAPVDPVLVVVDPGADAGGSGGGAGGLGRSTTSALATPAAAPAAALPTATTRPAIYSRAQWGADERLMTWTPQTGNVVGAVVHHTAGSNDYTADQVPALIRGIYAYHAQSRGWGDIGYNFLVDKYGRIWEGRAGGIDRGIVGAHASGVNSQRFGVSVMGNFDAAQVSWAAVDAVSAVIAWKLDIHGVRGTAGSIVVGHRDVGQTSCPGASLYAALPQVRALAASRQGPVTDRSLRRDVGLDGYPDLVARTSGSISLLTAPDAGWGATRTVGSGWPGERVIAPGDWNGDGNPDLMLIDPATGYLWLYPGTASGGWAGKQRIGTGWGVANLIVGGQDWDGDDRNDLIMRRHDGSLWLYPGDGRGGFGTARKIGAGWNGMSTIAMVGDLRDGRPALVARAGGDLYTYVGDGRGGFSGTRTFVGPGWDVMSTIVGAGDLNDDGLPDVVARDTQGRLWRYVGDGGGGLVGRSLIGTGWGGFSVVHPAGRSGRGEDFFAVRRDGTLLRYDYRGGAAFSRVAGTGVSGSGVVEAIAPGDWNGDGRPDLMTRRSNGDLYLHVGTSTGSFNAAGSRVGTGWGVMTQVVGAGDWLGTGVPGLIALQRGTGQIWLYPGDGRGGFGTPLVIARGAQFIDRIVNAGHWRGAATPDLIARDAGTGRLLLYPGNGGALLGSSTVVGTGWQGMSNVVGAGDVDGDGRPDLVASRAGSLVLYPGNGSGGFRAARTLTSAPSGANVS